GDGEDRRPDLQHRSGHRRRLQAAGAGREGRRSGRDHRRRSERPQQGRELYAGAVSPRLERTRKAAGRHNVFLAALLLALARDAGAYSVAGADAVAQMAAGLLALAQMRTSSSRPFKCSFCPRTFWLAPTAVPSPPVVFSGVVYGCVT